LRADPNSSGEGVILEAKLDKGFGILATVLMQSGTLKKQDTFVVGTAWGKVRTLKTANGVTLEVATPGYAVEVVGFKAVPNPGLDLIVVENEKKAKFISEKRAQTLLEKASQEATEIQKVKEREERAEAIAKREREAAALLENPGEEIVEEKKVEEVKEKAREIPVIIKADSHGSLGALHAILKELPGADEITLRFLTMGVGDIVETDVTLAGNSNAILVAFNVKSSTKMNLIATSEKVTILQEKIIYSVVDKITAILGGMLKPSIEYTIQAEAEVQAIFNVTVKKKNDTQIAGCTVTKGVIQRGSRVRIMREGKAIQETKVVSLRYLKDDVKEIKKGSECGMGLEFQDIQEGDLIQIYKYKEIPRKLGEPFQIKTI
jgi:translation initiation factor IF-2